MPKSFHGTPVPPFETQELLRTVGLWKNKAAIKKAVDPDYFFLGFALGAFFASFSALGVATKPCSSKGFAP